MKPLRLVLVTFLVFFAATGFPDIAAFVHRNRQLVVLAVGVAILGTWGVSLWKQRSSTPEFTRDAAWFALTLVMIAFTVIRGLVRHGYV